MRRRTARISESPRNAPSIMWAPQDDGATPLAKAQPPALNPNAHPEEDLRVAEIAGMKSFSVFVHSTGHPPNAVTCGVRKVQR
jgi:hypothetical protein